MREEHHNFFTSEFCLAARTPLLPSELVPCWQCRMTRERTLETAQMQQLLCRPINPRTRANHRAHYHTTLNEAGAPTQVTFVPPNMPEL
ncbi:hypothetical protein VTL71DRAFT_12153 [Oculimacula yallundae]|uniref:Uncharacterized protein n=1 Tax=Oculimacula yallundae TaxID=86028 RepID=A0ABR4CS72_9HELO